MKKNYHLTRVASLFIVTVVAGISALSAQSLQDNAVKNLQSARREMIDKMAIELRSDPAIAMWDSMVMFEHGTNKRFGKFVNVEYDKNGISLITDVYEYDTGMEVRMRNEMKWGQNYPYYHARHEYGRLLEMKSSIFMMGISIPTSTQTWKYDTNGLLTQYNISGLSGMTYSVVSKTDARNRVISEEQTATGGIYWHNYYEYGTNGKMSKWTMKTGTGIAAQASVTTSTLKYNAQNMIIEGVDETETATEKYIEKYTRSYDSQGRISRDNYFTDKETGNMVQTHYAIYYYGGKPASIDNIQSSGLTAYAQNGTLYVTLNPNRVHNPVRVFVYNILGGLVYQGVVNSDKLEIALPGRGVYIVTDGKEVIKIAN